MLLRVVRNVCSGTLTSDSKFCPRPDIARLEGRGQGQRNKLCLARDAVLVDPSFQKVRTKFKVIKNSSVRKCSTPVNVIGARLRGAMFDTGGNVPICSGHRPIPGNSRAKPQTAWHRQRPISFAFHSGRRASEFRCGAAPRVFRSLRWPNLTELWQLTYQSSNSVGNLADMSRPSEFGRAKLGAGCLRLGHWYRIHSGHPARFRLSVSAPIPCYRSPRPPPAVDRGVSALSISAPAASAVRSGP